MTQGQLRTRLPILAALVMLLLASFGTSVEAHPGHGAHPNRLPTHASETMKAFARDQNVAQMSSGALSNVQCVGGKAAQFPCSNVDLMSYLPLADIGATGSSSKANDIWGWTDATGREYAIIGHVFGTSFVDITSPTAPVYLGQLPTHGNFGSSWRDIKVYANHAFIVSEASRHGMQVFDLTQLSGRSGPPVTFTETAHYSGISTAHNIAINETTGFAYIVGAAGKGSCEGGLHMVDIGTPASPSFAGCYSADGYTHDTQCVVYAGPDADHRNNREICFNSNEDTLTIVDVTNKSNPVLLSSTGYTGSAYTHQGWLTEDQRHFLIDDEMDERNFVHPTRTRVFDIADLSEPSVTRVFDSAAGAIDHNQYVKGNRVYQANYTAGLRLLDFTDLATSNLTEFGYFDVYPDGDAPTFNGAWSTYPYYPSGNVVISGIEQGLFVVRAADATTSPPPDPDPDPDPAASMHLGSLTGGASPTRGGKWDASVTIPVHDDTEVHGPVDGATVTGTWSDGATGSGSCTTNTNGACTVTKTNISRHSASATFTVTDVSLTGFVYDPVINHGPNFITLDNPN